MWLPHSGLGFQRPVGRRMRCAALLRLTPQATIALRYYYYHYHYYSYCLGPPAQSRGVRQKRIVVTCGIFA